MTTDHAARAFAEQSLSREERIQQLASRRQGKRPVITPVAPKPAAKIDPKELDFASDVTGPGINIPAFNPPLANPQAKYQETDRPTDTTRVNRPEVSNVREEVTPLHDSLWERVDLPSRFIPYPFKQMNIRRLNIPDLLKVSKALRHTNTTVLYDALGATIDQDIRNLTPADFRYIMYWHRMYSYVKSPFVIEWTSRYGNTNKYSIQNSNLTVTYFGMPQEEYDEWNKKGYACPTVRDAEVFESGALAEDQQDAFSRAQYICPKYVQDEIAVLKEKGNPFPSMQARINEAIRRGIECWEEIRDFREKLNFGVEEVVKLRDKNFNPTEWLKKIESDLVRLKKSEIEEYLIIAEHMEQERDDIKTKLKDGQPVVPEEQEVALNFSAFNLFPRI